MKRHNDRRSGAVLIAVLVCMGVAITILLAAVQLSLHQRRQAKLDLQMEQTRWLMDAGIAHAIDQVRSDRGYAGESIDASPMVAGNPTATIEIGIGRDSGPEGEVEIQVNARMCGTGEQPAWTRRSKKLYVKPESYRQTQKSESKENQNASN